MAYDIGPKIGIDGESEFRKSINSIVQSVKTLGTEMKAVSSEFGDNQNSQEALVAKNKVLNKQIEQQRKRLELLADGLKKCSEKYGENDIKTMRWEASVNTARAELNRMEKELSDNVQTLNKMENGLDDVAEGFEKTEKDALSFGDVLKANVVSDFIIEGFKELAGEIKEMAEQSREYRKIMGSLEVSSKDAGYTAKETKEVYDELYGVLADDQTAATTTANLQALNLEQSELKQLVDGTIGAWAEYGDSIPIDGLAEAINETVKVGKVTGTFADVLNWAGKSEDGFNEKLAKAKNETERANIVLQELASQGLMEAGTKWQENNASLVEANKATSEYEAATARLGETAEPIITAVTDQMADFINWIVDNKEDVLAFVVGIGVAFGVWNVASMIQGVVKAIKAFKLANEGATISQLALNAAQMANPIGLLVALIAGLVAAIVVAWKTNEDFRKKVIKVWETVKKTISTVIKSCVAFFENLGEKAKELGTKIKVGIKKGIDFIVSLPSTMRSIGGNLIAGLWNGISDKITWIKTKIKEFGKSVISAIKDVFGVHSPSVVMKEVGMYLAQGLGIGYEEEMPNTFKKMKNAFNLADIQNGKILANAKAEINNAIDYDRLEQMQGKGIYLNGREVGREMRKMGVVFVG